MRTIHTSVVAVAAAVAMTAALVAQQEDPDRKVAGGGITVAGWEGKVDPGAAKKGMTIKDSKFAAEGNALHLTIGPAAVYWNPANKVAGDYSVKATFRETKPDASHPHPYGVFIGGSELGTDQQKLLYCVAYSNGTFLVRGFSGPDVITVKRREAHPAVKKAGEDGSVTQEVGWNVRGNRAECIINGQVVAGFDKSEISGDGKLASTDGIYGLRVSHNLDVVVTGLSASK